MPDPKPPPWRSLTRAGILVGALGMFVGLALFDILDYVEFRSPAVLIPFGGGAALFLGGVLLNLEWLWQHVSRKKFLVGLNVWAMVALSVVLLLIANAIAGCTPQTEGWFLDLTKQKLHTLSPYTRNILGALQKDVRITVVLGSGEVSAPSGATIEVGPQVKELTQFYRAASRRIQVEILDSYRDKTRAEQIALRLKGPLSPDSLVVECEARNVHIPFADLVNVPPWSASLSPSALPAPSFKGEDKLSTAILNVTEEQQAAVCFLAGHGEMALDKGGEDETLSQFALELKRENYRVEPLNLAQRGEIPADCALLVIAGARAPFKSSEVELLRRYLDKNGRLFVLIRPRGKIAGLTALLADYNVKTLEDEVTIQIERETLTGRQVGKFEVPVEEYASHPITEDLATTYHYLPTVSPVQASLPDPGPAQRGLTHPYAVTTLLRSGRMSFASSDPKFDPDKADRGPLSLGVAVERRPKASSPESAANGPRLVVLGSCAVASDATLSRPADYGDDRALLLNCVNWLASKETKIGIPPKVAEHHAMNGSPAAFKAAFFITIIVLPLMAVFAGGFVWWIRRR